MKKIKNRKLNTTKTFSKVNAKKNRQLSQLFLIIMDVFFKPLQIDLLISSKLLLNCKINVY